MKMKQKKLLEANITNIFYSSLALFLISIIALFMGYLAVDDLQGESGVDPSMIGYNRDWLVAATPYFIASLTASALLCFHSLYRLFRQPS